MLSSKGMNLLAHLYLTASSPAERMVGNFIADRVKGRRFLEHPPEVAKGILLHRSIDSFTDEHPRMMENKSLLHPYHGKWAGVLIDIYNDHFLANDWERYHPEESLEEMTERVQGILSAHREWMNERDRFVLDRMMKDSWLVGYKQKEGLERAFRGLSMRTGRAGFERAVETLEKLETPLREGFNDFFPDLIEHVKKWEADEANEIGPSSDRTG